jgi:hypothetical protein
MKLLDLFDILTPLSVFSISSYVMMTLLVGLAAL